MPRPQARRAYSGEACLTPTLMQHVGRGNALAFIVKPGRCPGLHAYIGAYFAGLPKQNSFVAVRT